MSSRIDVWQTPKGWAVDLALLAILTAFVLLDLLDAWKVWSPLFWAVYGAFWVIYLVPLVRSLWARRRARTGDSHTKDS